jgi:hypothetical protein
MLVPSPNCKIFYAPVTAMTRAGVFPLSIVRREKRSLNQFELRLWLFHCRYDRRL